MKEKRPLETEVSIERHFASARECHTFKGSMMKNREEILKIISEEIGNSKRDSGGRGVCEVRVTERQVPKQCGKCRSYY
jgi:hypothetical protein